jgi:hypothetical protein
MYTPWIPLFTYPLKVLTALRKGSILVGVDNSFGELYGVASASLGEVYAIVVSRVQYQFGGAKTSPYAEVFHLS